MSADSPDTTKAPEAVALAERIFAVDREKHALLPWADQPAEAKAKYLDYARALSPLPLEGGEALREKVARAVASELIRQDYCEDEIDPFPSGELTWRYIDQGEVDFGKIADRILATLSALQSGGGNG